MIGGGTRRLLCMVVGHRFRWCRWAGGEVIYTTGTWYGNRRSRTEARAARAEQRLRSEAAGETVTEVCVRCARNPEAAK